MRILDMIDMLPPRDDMLNMARYFARTRRPDRGSLILTGAAGVCVGAAVALLLAPHTGRELRRQIGERAEGLREKAQGFGSRMRANGSVHPTA